MRDDRPSATAELVCYWRALEHLRPVAGRIVDDPFARAFLGPVRGGLVDLAARLPGPARAAFLRATDQAVVGALTFVVARHRAIDDALVAGRQPQVVLLGAGYDSRAVRLEPALRGRVVIEVDHPATAARKRALAGAAFGDAPRADVVPLTVDFARESLEERLRGAGHDPLRPTFWVWEGVSMYLPEPAVDHTLRLLRRLSAPGSRLVLDTWSPPGGLLRRLTRAVPSLFFRLTWGEPLLWGPAPEEVAPYLAARGFTPTDVTPGADLIRRYDARRLPFGPVSLHMGLAVGDVV